MSENTIAGYDIPNGATHWLGGAFAKWLDNNYIAVIGVYQGATWSSTKRGMPRNAIDIEEVSSTRDIKKLTARNAELESALIYSIDIIKAISDDPEVLNVHKCHFDQSDIDYLAKALKDNKND